MKYLLLFSLSLVFSACSAVPPDDLTLQYARKARELGIVPVYPPREEFQLGDVYVWSQSKENPNDTVRVWVTSFDWLRKDADDFLATRVVFRATGEDPKKQGADLYGTTTKLRSEQRAESLPITAFPSVSGDAGFSAGAGIFKALRAIGLAGGAQTKVTLNFNDVRTYWVPNTIVGEKAKQHLKGYLDQNDPALFGVAYPELVKAAKRSTTKVSDVCGDDRTLGLSIITRVYLTRKIDFTYRNARIVAAGISRATAGIEGNEKPAVPNVTINNIPTVNDSGEVTVGNDLLSDLQTIVASDNQGKSFSFQTWDARGLTFRQTFLRPVAIGWEGFTYEKGIRETICPDKEE